MRYKLIISYDGTNYSGWQVQKNAPSIQSLIQNALQTVLRHPLNLTGSGRTDAGVHAKGQTAHFDTDIHFEPYRLRGSLNSLLPADIRIVDILPVAADFHARYSASGKVYHYHLHLDPISDPFTKLYCHQVFGSFDLEKLKKGAGYFIGTHDFISFANVKDEPQKDTTRTIKRLDIIEQKGGVRLEFEGNGFLYKMVRNITGLLLDIGAGRVQIEEIPQIFEARDRRKAGTAAPAQGLFLYEVKY
ncbi:MAG: tRNA pseudouridine(38-40) synthase TruA [Chlamydiae bacterium CG10_big_fil_rev_8_21_14_0_10_42_34]|nr:MAG: tRNA pseudouridine(38-40) synthase TruA [Chlamydiae bacterium CG10_big_fil_rev_8_21_14_0_10_42_34]